MGSRLLYLTLHLTNKTLYTLARIPHITASIRLPIYGFRFSYELSRALHYKISDKDAGLEAQREANKLRNNNETLATQGTSSRTYGELQLETKKLLENKTVQNTTKNGPSAADDPDVFGATEILEEWDAGDAAEEEFIQNPTRRSKKLRTKEYAQLIKEHLNANRLRDAIDVLEQRMLKEDRVKPENYIYNLLISGCAKAGYTRKAFSLFNKMRQRGLKITGGTYTSLFNACATAPSAVDGINQANHLREIMLEKGYEPNLVNYNAMIKAYGRCGDVKTAYMLADEMLEKQLEVNASTFNFLLQACACDKEYGFRHCLLTWHKMLQHGIQPDHYSFNTVLRCVRDCGIGDLSTMDQVLKQILRERQGTFGINHSSHTTENVNEPQRKLHGNAQQQLTAQTASNSETTETENLAIIAQADPTRSIQLAINSTSLEIPNLLAVHPHLGSLVSISEITRPHDRFLLIGGLTGFLELMKQHNITPGIESFTAMLEVIPPTNAAEKQLISFIRKIGLKSDIDFFNILIKKRSMRFDYEGAKEVLNMIRTAGLKPDIVTYGVLALGCQTEEDARELLQRMRDLNVRLNVQILGAMLRQGCAQKSFPYIMEILQISLDENVKPNDVFLRHLHTFYNQCARAIDSRHPFTKTKSFKKGHEKFCAKYRLWYEEQGLSGLKLEDAIKKLKERPYQQYKEEVVDGMEPVKNERLARQKKVRKYIKKIKIENLKGEDKPLQNEHKYIE